MDGQRNGPGPEGAGHGPKNCSDEEKHTGGEFGKQLAFNLFREHRTELLAQARRVMLDVAREQGQVTIEDVRVRMNIPGHLNPVWLGAVPGPLARRGLIRRSGYVNAGRTQAHARPITVWAFVREAEPGERDDLLSQPEDRPDRPNDDVVGAGVPVPTAPDGRDASATAMPLFPDFRPPERGPGHVGTSRDGRRRR